MEMCENKQDTAERKRKPVDSIPLDEQAIEEDGGEVGDGEESNTSSREEGQEWDADSFDDEVYYKPKPDKPIDEKGEKFYRYRHQLYRSRGFHVDEDCYSGNVFCRQLRPIDLDDDEPFKTTGLTCRDYIDKMIDLSLAKYNFLKGSNVKRESVVRVIMTEIMGIKCYITFMARETPDGDVVEYQAKTDMRVWQKHSHVIFCRPSPEPKEPPVDAKYDVTDSSSSDSSSGYSDQIWDYDSFDEEPDYKLPRFNTPPDEEVKKMQLFRPQMRNSKGFNVDGERYSGGMRYFLPVNLDEILKPYQITGREYMEEMAKLAVGKYNDMKKSNLTFHSVVRANLTVVNGFKSYITFMAREVPDGDPVEYQAKTERLCNQRNPRAIFCRRSPKSND